MYTDYKPLDRARNEVRLLTLVANEQPDSSPIQCRLEQVSLDDHPEYVALSYTWGDNTNPTRKITVGETGFEATKSLESALRRFRHAKHDIRIWADAICINQKDLLERGQQVQIMQRIYGQARAVWVWLGEEGEDSGGAMDLIEALADVQIDCLGRAGGDYERKGPRYDATLWGLPQSWGVGDELVALGRLLLGRGGIGYGRSVAWQQIVKAGDLLLAHLQDVVKILQHQSSSTTRGVPGLFRVAAIDAVRVILRCGGRYPILVLLSQHCNAGATDMRDKFIALAGLAQERGLLDSDRYYLQPVAEVYKLVAKLIAAHDQDGSLDFICYGGRPKERMDLPSWTPDWSYTGVRPCALLQWQLQPPEISSYYGDLDRFNAAGPTGRANSRSFCFSDDLELLTAKGVKFDIVDGLNPNLSRPEASHFVSEQMGIDNFKMIQPSAKHDHCVEIEDVIEVFWRTLVMDKSDLAGEKAPSEWQRLFWALFLQDDIPQIPNYTYIRDWYGTIRELKINGHTVEQLIYHMKDKHATSFSEHELSPEDLKILISMSFAVERATAFRRIVTTCKGYLALTPADTRRGDIVCILFDCHVPLIIRSCNNHFELIGECYLHELMKGQAMKGVNEQQLEIQDFTLC